MGNPEELINWRIRLNHFIWNKLCKLPKSWFDMVEMLLGGKDCNTGANLSLRQWVYLFWEF
eukprot:10741835-Ditylum_brightwellii.AAC.1